MRVLVAGRSKSEKLYDLSREFLTSLPWDTRRCSGYDTWRSGLTYFIDLINDEGYDWVVNIDEDAFVFDPSRIPLLLDFMDKNGYVACGYPEGGVMPTRRKNPIVPNAFFNIINTSVLRPVDRKKIEATKCDESWKDQLPDFVWNKGISYEFCEKGEWYYYLFFWILSQGHKILYLDASKSGFDSLSVTGEDHESVAFILHSWGGRSWENDQMAGRIESVRQKALSIQVKT